MDLLKFSLTVRPGGHYQKKLNFMLIYIHFCGLCPPGVAVKLILNMWQVAY